MNKNDLRVVIYKDDDCWFAQALEHNVFASGADRNESIENLKHTINLENEFKGGVKRLPQAPEIFFEMWEDLNGKPKQKQNKPHENSVLERISA